MISTSEIVDRERYEKYVEQAGPIVESYGGEYLLQSGKIIAAEGIAGSENIVDVNRVSGYVYLLDGSVFLSHLLYL